MLMKRIARATMRLSATENEEVATLTATIETSFRQGDLETGVGSLSGDQVSSERAEERQKSRAEELRSRSLLRRSAPLPVRRLLWPYDSMDGCAQRRGCGWPAKGGTCPQPHGHAVVFYFGWFDVVSLPIVETQKSQRNVSGVDHRETGMFFWEKERRHCL